MRKLKMLFVGAVFALGVSTQAQAGTITSSSLSLGVGALPPISIPGAGLPQVVGSGSFPLIYIPATPTVALGTSLFTGVSLISGLTLVVGSGTVSVVSDGSAVGVIGGTTFVNILKLFNLAIPLSLGGGATIQAVAGGLVITVTPAAGAGWTVGSVPITGITTELPGTTVVNTVVVAGSPTATTTGSAASGTLVWASRATTSAAGNLPVFAFLSWSGTGLKTHVPEPGTFLLLGSGIAGLALLGRRRMRK